MFLSIYKYIFNLDNVCNIYKDNKDGKYNIVVSHGTGFNVSTSFDEEAERDSFFDNISNLLGVNV